MMMIRRVKNYENDLQNGNKALLVINFIEMTLPPVPIPLILSALISLLLLQNGVVLWSAVFFQKGVEELDGVLESVLNDQVPSAIKGAVVVVVGGRRGGAAAESGKWRRVRVRWSFHAEEIV